MESSSSPRVLIVAETHYPVIQGGVDTMIADLLPALEETGWQPVLFIPQVHDWERKRLSREELGGVTVFKKRIRLPWDPCRPVRGALGWLLEFPGALGELTRLARQEQIRRMHLQSLASWQYAFALAARVLAIPYLVTVHGSELLAPRAFFRRLADRFVLAGASHVTAVSDATAERARALFPWLRQVVVVRNGVGRVTPDESVVVEGAYFLLAGGLTASKGQEEAIRAWGRFADALGGVPLLLAGVGKHEEALRKLAVVEEVADRVRFLGRLPREGWLGLATRATGVLFPSRFEGLPYALLEAGALGCAVVVSDIPPHREVVTPEEEGIMTAAGDVEALGRAVLRLLADPGAGRRRGKRLADKVNGEFSARRMAREYGALYGR